MMVYMYMHMIVHVHAHGYIRGTLVWCGRVVAATKWVLPEATSYLKLPH